MNDLFDLGIILLLVLMNGFFVASEFALVAVRRPRIASLAEDGNRRAVRLLRVLDRLNAFISATQLGITLASLALGWLGEPVIAELLAIPLQGHVTETTIHIVAVSVAFTVITFLHIVLGELAPKTFALERAEQVALGVAFPLEIFYRVFAWPIRLLDWAGTFTVRALGLRPTHEHGTIASADELRHLIDSTRTTGALGRVEQNLLNRVLDFAETRLREVMTPRTSMESVPVDSTFAEVRDAFRTLGYSRLPVYEDTVDEVVGIVHRKDLEPFLEHPDSPDFQLSTIIKPAHFMPESALLGDALKQMQSARAQISIVVDEHGGVKGMVSIEDLLEELVGEIYDEYDDVLEATVVPLGEGAFSVAGMLSIREVNRLMDLDLPEEHGVSTLGGFLMARHGRPLQSGQTVYFDDIEFKVTAVEKRRVRRVRVKLPIEPSPPLS